MTELVQDELAPDLLQYGIVGVVKLGRMGIQTKKSPSLYTSVHYVIAPNLRTPLTCEIQVRTLADELWGEVDHTIKYPHPSESLACSEQIKVLARVTSSCTRLVDAIFVSHQDHQARATTPTVKRTPTKRKK